MFRPVEITLEEMLQARDRRFEHECSLLEKYPGTARLVLTIVAPGREKRNRATAIVASAALKALDRDFDGNIIYSEERDLPTGFERFMVINLPVAEAKRIASAIEDSHPLGRLMDIDIIGDDRRPISRATLGLPPRGCLICGEDARVCMRAARHSYEELLTKISEMTDAYVPDA